jgi:hypothetical protein
MSLPHGVAVSQYGLPERLPFCQGFCKIAKSSTRAT